MIEKILAGTLALSISGCSMLGGFNALDPKNLIKTAATTGATYVVAGPIPAAVNAATSVAIDSVLPDDKPAISEIEAGNEEQLAVDQRRKDKYDAMKAELAARRSKD